MTKLSAVLAALATVGFIPAASACGGFFCSANQPVDQAGEHILFGVDGTTVTAHIQIQYQGPSDDFSWVLPMPSVPEFGVGSDLLFQRLRQLTDPRFQLNWEHKDDCTYDPWCNFGSDGGDSTGGDVGGTGDGGGGGIDILAEGAVGPFEFKVVASDDSEALFTWLNDNGYDQPEAAQDIISHYVGLDHVFVALKLLKDKEAGDIQPLVLTYEAPDLACIPLRLTSIAAKPDMPVWAWVLAKARAVPMNYFHVLLNAKAYDWWNCAGYFGWGGKDCSGEYTKLVTDAANTAGGNAFVTEFAGKTADMGTIFGWVNNVDLADIAMEMNPTTYLQELFSAGIPSVPAVQALIRKWIPKPDDSLLPEDCQGDSSFYAFWNLENCLQHMPEDWTWDPVGMTADLKETVVDPALDAEGLFDLHPYATRLFTTVSPDEMTKDPMFSFNPDLPDVSNVHTATASAVCKPGSTTEVHYVEVTFPWDPDQKHVIEGVFEECSASDVDWADGGGSTGGGSTGGDDGGGGFSPVADIQIMNESGEPESVPADQVEQKAAEIEARVGNIAQAGVSQSANPSVKTNVGLWGSSEAGPPPVDGSGTTGGSGDTGDTTTTTTTGGTSGGAVGGITAGGTTTGATTGGGSGDGGDSSSSATTGSGSDDSGCTAGGGSGGGGWVLALGLLCLVGLRGRRFSQSGAALLALTLLVAAPTDAEACGGFFCSASQPVDQAGEHILFAVDGTDITAHIQIAYQGDAEKFSWVLPMPSIPEFEVGTDVLFQRLRSLTDPKFQLNWNNAEGCSYTNSCGGLEDAAGGDDGGGTGGGGGGVSVVSEGEVGPFEYKVVQSNDGDALFTWLNDNGYDQPDSAADLITHYTNLGFVFATLKMQKGKAAGDLQPIIVKYTSETFACIPLKLTSIAATANMPVFAWVLAEQRAIPLNYFHVLVNPKKYDWMNCSTDAAQQWDNWLQYGQQCAAAYMDLVTQAADAANGHAFVTEYAGTAEIMANQIVNENQFNTDALKSEATPGAFMQAMMGQGFPRDALVQEIIRQWIPKPETVGSECAEDSQFYATWNIDDCIQYMPEGWTFDAAGMAADLEDRIVKPMTDAQALFSTYHYMTRMFTTISPDEMTKDPVFSFNADLPDVSNIFTADAVATCKEGSSWEAETVEITFGDGTTKLFEGDFNGCGGWAGGVAESDGGGDLAPEEDAAAAIQVLNESGAPTEVSPEDVNATEAQIEARTPGGGGDGGIGGGTDGSGTTTGSGSGSGSGSSSDSGSSSGCTAAAPGTGSAPFALVLLAGLALIAVMRRRSIPSA